MSSLQLIIYYSLKGIIRMFLLLFYPRTHVTGSIYLQLKYPTLVVSNHPNTLIDALNAAGRVSAPLFMLANAGLFKTPLSARLFSFLFCIPIERPQDVNGRPINNDGSFEKCFYHLRKGRHIFIAPEGSSEMERRIRPLRTGTARIALGAEASADFKLGLRILPIGLTYQEPDRCGSALAVQIGAPIIVKDWESIYFKDPRNAFKDLTQKLETTLRQLVTDTPDQETDRLLHLLENITQAGKLPLPEPLFYHSRDLLRWLQDWKATHPASYQEFSATAQEYARLLSTYELQEAGMEQQHSLFKAYLTAFPWLIPWTTSWLVYIVPVAAIRSLVRRLQIDPGYTATVKWVGALIVLPIWIGLLLVVASFFMHTRPLALLSIGLLGLGYVYTFFKPQRAILHAQTTVHVFRKNTPQQWQALKEKRQYIVDRLPH